MPIRAATVCRFAMLIVCASIADRARAALPVHYETDPAFNAGLYVPDRFAGSTSDNFQGRKLALMPNGDVVVAGRISWNGANDPAGSLQLGLVRYDTSGQRVAWSGPAASPYFHDGRQYVVFPKNDPSIPATRYAEVVDLMYHAGFLYVLADSNYSPPGHAVFVVIFREDGSYVGMSGVFGDFSEDPRGAALQLLPGFAFAPDRLMVVASRTPPGRLRTMSMVRLAFQANGSLSLDPMPGADPSRGIKDIPMPPPPLCLSIPTFFQCPMVASATADTGPFGAIYVGGSIQQGATSSDWDFVVTKIDQDGNPQGDFGIAGQATVAVNLNHFGSADLLSALVAKPVVAADGFSVDAELFLVGNAPTDLNGSASEFAIAKVKPGVGVGAGLLDAAFGTDGLALVATCVPGGGDACGQATAATLDRDLVTVVGWALNPAYDANASTVVAVDQRTGVLINATKCMYADLSTCTGSILGTSRLYDVARTPEGTLITTGTLHEPSGGTEKFGTLRFRPKDHLFADDFQDHG